jgi:hypothetical protein
VKRNTRSQKNSTNPITLFVNATIAAIAAATTAVATNAVTTTALEVPDSDSDDTDDTTPPLMQPKKEHGLTIIYGMDINNHLKSIKSDIRILIIKLEPGTSNTRYVNGIHFHATVLTITEALVEVMNLLSELTNIGNRKDVRTVDIIGFLAANGVKLTSLANNYEKIMTTNHASPIIIEYSVLRHPFESTDLPTSWLQFYILFQKEKLLVPFNQKYEAINLGNQFNEQK